jgi:hypothetical protein
MNLREICNQSCAWTADHCNLCEEESTRGVYPIRRVTYEMSVRNNQRTACNIEQSVDKQRQKPMEEARLLSTYVSYVEVNGETRAFNRIEMNAPRGGQAIM